MLQPTSYAHKETELTTVNRNLCIFIQLWNSSCKKNIAHISKLARIIIMRNLRVFGVMSLVPVTFRFLQPDFVWIHGLLKVLVYFLLFKSHAR